MVVLAVSVFSPRERAIACSPMRKHGVQSRINFPSLRKLATEVGTRLGSTPLSPAYAGSRSVMDVVIPMPDAWGYTLSPAYAGLWLAYIELTLLQISGKRANVV